MQLGRCEPTQATDRRRTKGATEQKSEQTATLDATVDTDDNDNDMSL